MADEALLKILKEGPKVWNEWREKNPHVPIELGTADLVAADLRGADLRGVGLSRSNLSQAALVEANLINANLFQAQLCLAALVGANLADADLREADLRRADLRRADLFRANLQGADLRDADLRGASFIEAKLVEADLQGSSMGYTAFGDVDLSMVKGLETVRHSGPSTIGIDTIYRSKAKISDVFLRGAGVPDNFVTYMMSLAGTVTAFEYYSCFISYSSKDEDFANRLYADLQTGHIRCWFAPEDLKIGDKFRSRIDEAIRIYDKLLLILSENSIHSPWVEKEVETAFEKERKSPGKTVLFPIRLDDAVMKTDQAWAADIRRTRHIGDFSNWKNHDEYKKAFDRLLRDLKAKGRRNNN
jgi:hypothetical protein